MAVIVSLSRHCAYAPSGPAEFKCPQRRDVMRAFTMGCSVQVQPADTTLLIMLQCFLPLSSALMKDRNVLCLTIDNGPSAPPPPPCGPNGRGSPCCVALASSCSNAQRTTAAFVSSSRLGPRRTATVPSFVTLPGVWVLFAAVLSGG